MSYLVTPNAPSPGSFGTPAADGPCEQFSRPYEGDSDDEDILPRNEFKHYYDQGDQEEFGSLSRGMAIKPFMSVANNAPTFPIESKTKVLIHVSMSNLWLVLSRCSNELRQ